MFIFLSIFSLVNKSIQKEKRRRKEKARWVINDHCDLIYHEVINKKRVIIAKIPLMVSRYSQFIVTIESW